MRICPSKRTPGGLSGQAEEEWANLPSPEHHTSLLPGIHLTPNDTCSWGRSCDHAHVAARTCSIAKTPVGPPTGMPARSRTAHTLVLCPMEPRKLFGCRSSGMKLHPAHGLLSQKPGHSGGRMRTMRAVGTAIRRSIAFCGRVRSAARDVQQARATS